jgi:hypothetical protein
LKSYTVKGKDAGSKYIQNGREILGFNMWYYPKVNDSGKTKLCVIHADPEKQDVRIAGWDSETGGVEWEHSLPSGQDSCFFSIERIITCDITGDSNLEWIVPASDGSIRVFASCEEPPEDLPLRPKKEREPSEKKQKQDGKLLDTFSFGRLLNGFAVVRHGEKRLLIIADAENVTCFEIW